MLDTYTLNTLSKDKKIELLNYGSQMDSDVIDFLNWTASNDDWIPSIYNISAQDIRINEYSNFYLSHSIIHRKSSTVPRDSMIDKYFCMCVSRLNGNEKISNAMKQKILAILRMPSYDIPSLLQVESAISSMLEYAKTKYKVNSIEYKEILDFINHDLMELKTGAVDLNEKISVIATLGYFADPSSITDDSHPLSTLIMEINAHINENNATINNPVLDIGNMNDTAIFIYSYYRYLHNENNIDVLGKRYYDYIESCYGEESKEQLHSIIEDYCNNKSSIISATNGIINPCKIDNTAMPDDAVLNGSIMNDSIADEINNTIFFGDNVFGDMMSLNTLFSKLNTMNIEYIQQHNDESFDLSKFSFKLSEDDISYLQRYLRLPMLLVLNKDTMDVKYIVKYDKYIMLLYKIQSYQMAIFGLSINENDNGDKVIMKATKDGNYYYRYFSEI